MKSLTLDSLENIFFLGIGGIGMSALAHFFLQQGKKVSGYDLTPSLITQELSEAGAHIIYEDTPSLLPEVMDLVVYTPAVPKSSALYQTLHAQELRIMKRSEILGLICSQFPTIAVAGTHGKTTTTALTAHLLKEEAVMAFVGGVMKENNANYLMKEQIETVIVEADEFDRSFLTLFPKTAIVTCIEADHLDIYQTEHFLKESFQQFVSQINEAGQLVILEHFAGQIETTPTVMVYRYGFSDAAHFQISEVKTHLTQSRFTLTVRNIDMEIVGTYQNITLGMAGMHNILNAVAALAAASLHCQLPIEELYPKLESFQGIKRRFDVKIEREDFVYIDDYAHHPTEIEQCVQSVQQIFPEKKITAIFQPHLYTRTRDFAEEFAEALALLDEVILLDIYPARELPIEDVNSEMLLELLPEMDKKLLTTEAIIPHLQTQKPQVLLTLGAGNIDLLVPQIVKCFECASNTSNKT